MDAETILFLNNNRELITIISIVVSFPFGFIGSFLIHQSIKLSLKSIFLPFKASKRIRSSLHNIRVPPEPTLDNWL